MSCSARRHKPTHHLPSTVLALPHAWYPESYIPLFTLHCKNSPVNKQVVSATVHIWRGSFGLWRRPGGSHRPGEGAGCGSSPAGSRLKGRPCRRPALSLVVWQGNGTKPARHPKPSHRGGQLAATDTAPTHPLASAVSRGWSHPCCEVGCPCIQGARRLGAGWRRRGGGGVLVHAQRHLAGQAKEESTEALTRWLDNWAH